VAQICGLLEYGTLLKILCIIWTLALSGVVLWKVLQEGIWCVEPIQALQIRPFRDTRASNALWLMEVSMDNWNGILPCPRVYIGAEHNAIRCAANRKALSHLLSIRRHLRYYPER
jgi:hypothetical protein